MAGRRMIAPSRRGFLTGLGAGLVALAAPAVIRIPGLLMPVRALAKPEPFVWITFLPTKAAEGDFRWFGNSHAGPLRVETWSDEGVVGNATMQPGLGLGFVFVGGRWVSVAPYPVENVPNLERTTATRDRPT